MRRLPISRDNDAVDPNSITSADSYAATDRYPDRAAWHIGPGVLDSDCSAKPTHSHASG